jgi:CRP/FNR family cyclic AMP-dependent transcriptional regulator
MTVTRRQQIRPDRFTPIKAVPFFTQLTESELEIVRGLSSEKPFPRSAVVLSEGDLGDSLYMIESGKVKVFISDKDGREMILKLLGRGDFFGELAMIDKQPRSASITTLEASVFLILTHEAFEQCVARIPRIANMVMRVLAQRVRDADRKIGTLAMMDVYGRVASTLLELAVNDKDGKLMVTEKLSQQDLANMVGASREMVNRILRDLSERGFISVESKSITILNKELPPSL